MDRYLHNDRHEDEPDVTPLVDTFSTLVAVLMVLMPTYTAISTRLVEVEGRSGVPSNQAIVLSFDRTGDLTWDQSPVTWEELKGRLRTLRKGEPDREVVVAGDPEAPYRLSLRLRALVSRQGIQVKELAKPGKDW